MAAKTPKLRWTRGLTQAAVIDHEHNATLVVTSAVEGLFYVCVSFHSLTKSNVSTIWNTTPLHSTWEDALVMAEEAAARGYCPPLPRDLVLS